MKLHELRNPAGARKDGKRVGRGPGSGWGKTSGKGMKGQNSRSGGNTTVGFEGGQMPLKRRLPKRGFTNIFKKRYALVNVRDLERFESSTTVDPATLVKAGLVRKLYDGVKILGQGSLTKPLMVKAHQISRQAKEKIEGAGGKAELI